MSIHIDTAIDEISKEIRRLKKQHEGLYYSLPSNPDITNGDVVRIKEGIKALRRLREGLEDFRVEGYSPV